MRKLAIVLVPLLLLALVVGAVGCGEEEEGIITPKPIPESTIPAHFSTYVTEGLFSISYPSDWAPATSIMGELWEETKEQMESEIPDISMEDASMLFFAGIPDYDGYYPTVNILVTPRAPGYWTLDEVAEAEDLLERMYPTPGYQLLSRTKTTVGEIEALIDDSVDNEPGYGKWRYIQAYLVKDKFVWFVTCAAESGDFEYYEDDFYEIVKSLRILQ
jgi:hypothetical protein